MSCQALRGGISRVGPPVKAPFGKTLVTEPETLAIIHQHLDGSLSAIAKAKHRPREGVFTQGVFAQPCQSIDAPAKIRRLGGDQDLHLRCNSQHQFEPRRLRPTTAISAA
nr:hypothetical protein [Gimesia maris]